MAPTPPSYAPAGAKFGGPKAPGPNWRGIGAGWWAPPGSKGKGAGKGAGMPITAWNNPKNPLYDPNQTLQGKSLLNAAQALANAATNPAIGQLQDQINLENKFATGQQKTDNAYFTGLEKFGQQGAQQIGQNDQLLQGGLNQIGQDTQNTLTQQGQNAQNTLAQYTPGDPSLRAAGMQGLTQEIARQQGLAAQDAGAFRAGGLTQSVNYSNLANANQGAYAAAGREDITKIAQANLQRQAPLTSKIAQLRANRANLIATNAGKLRQQEITNKFTSKGLDIKQQANQITAANDQAKNQLTLRGQNITAARDQATSALGWAKLSEKQQNDLANQAIRESSAAAKSGGGGVKRLSTQSNNTMQALLDTALAAVPNLQKTGASESDIRNSLAVGNVKMPSGARVPRIPDYLIQAAYELLGYGYISPATASKMHGAGMYGDTFRNAPIRVSSPPASNAGVDAVGTGAAGAAINTSLLGG